MSTLQRRTFGQVRPYKCRVCGGSNHTTEKDGHRRCSICRPRWSKEYLMNYLPDYRERNKEKLRIQRDAKYKSNRAKFLGMWAAYKARYPHIDREHRRRREQKIREGNVTREELEAIVERDEGLCIYCRAPVKNNCTKSRPRGFDHLVPLLHSTGEHALWNLAVCCIECNAAKNQTHLCDYVVRAEVYGPQLERLPDRAWGLE